MKNILVCACARRIRFSIAQREANYLKLVCFLYLKQEMAVSKHVKQMEKMVAAVSMTNLSVEQHDTNMSEG